MPEYNGGNNGGKPSGHQPSGSNGGSAGKSNDSKHGSKVKEETCPSCHGTKTCETCLGRGWRNICALLDCSRKSCSFSKSLAYISIF